MHQTTSRVMLQGLSESYLPVGLYNAVQPLTIALSVSSYCCAEYWRTLSSTRNKKQTHYSKEIGSNQSTPNHLVISYMITLASNVQSPKSPSSQWTNTICHQYKWGYTKLPSLKFIDVGRFFVALTNSHSSTTTTMDDEDGGILNIELSDDEVDVAKKKADRTGQSEEEFQAVKRDYQVRVENGEVRIIRPLDILADQNIQNVTQKADRVADAQTCRTACTTRHQQDAHSRTHPCRRGAVFFPPVSTSH